MEGESGGGRAGRHCPSCKSDTHTLARPHINVKTAGDSRQRRRHASSWEIRKIKGRLVGALAAEAPTCADPAPTRRRHFRRPCADLAPTCADSGVWRDHVWWAPNLRLARRRLAPTGADLRRSTPTCALAPTGADLRLASP
eukprot:scaffold12862_cov116-Isochrysis_galbana.AAC.5